MTAGDATREVPRGAGISCRFDQHTSLWQSLGQLHLGTYTDSDGAALAALLGGQRVGKTKVGAPVTTSDGDDAQLRDDDGGTDGSRDFLGGLDAETDMTLGVTDNHNGLKSRTLAGTSLLLNRLDL